MWMIWALLKTWVNKYLEYIIVAQLLRYFLETLSVGYSYDPNLND